MTQSASDEIQLKMGYLNTTDRRMFVFIITLLSFELSTAQRIKQEP